MRRRKTRQTVMTSSTQGLSVDRLQTMLEHAPFAVVSVDADLSVQVWNREAERLFGWTAGEVIGRPLPTLPGADAREELLDLIADPPTMTPTHEMDTVRRNRDGSLTHVRLCIAPLAGNSGLVAFVEDIDDLRRTEEALSESEDRFRMVFDRSNDAIMILDPSREEILDVNPRTCQLLGYSREELLSLAPTDIHPDEMPKFLDFAQSVVDAGHGWTDELTCLTKSGNTLPSEISASTIVLDDRPWMIAMIRDISDRKRAEEALTARTTALEQANDELEAVSRAMAHDLAEPLRTISGYVRLLAERYSDSLDHDAHEYIAFAVDGAGRMRSLIDDLLTFARVTREPPTRPQHDCKRVLEQTLNSLGKAIAEAGAIVTAGDLPTIGCDATEYGHVFQNLIENGIKFATPGVPPEVQITATRDAHAWTISVSDNGIGIDAAYHDRVFRMLTRLEGRDTYQGSGIGLAIAKKVVEFHGGRIWVESEPGRGSTFRFTIPDHADHDPSSRLPIMDGLPSVS